MKKRNISKAVLVMIAGAVSVCLCSCGSNSWFRRKRALSHMKKKYGIEFTMTEKSSGSGVFGTNSGYCDFYVTCDEYPDERIRVLSYDGVNFGSDFLRVKYKSELEDMLNEIGKDFYSGDRLKVLLNEGPSHPYEDDDLSFEDYLKSGQVSNFGICTDDNDDPEGDYGRLIGALQEKGVSCLPIVYHIGDGSYLEDDVNIHSLDTDKRVGAVRSNGMAMITDDDYSGKWKFTKGFG